ncbi:MAG TPA: sugar porter family MFS transporter [Streptosporangiaceae bacterium]|nr:sugar porter family MFS transporter [Streptosporangiaceae bacterium]
MATKTEAPAAQVPQVPLPPRLIFGRWRFWLFMVGLIVILTGLLFGYDQGVISGALQFIAKAFHLSTTLQEVVTSWVTLGALFGALLAGGLADRLGRQKTMVIGGVLFALGALGETLAPGTWTLVVSRFVLGFGVGAASVTGPLYAAEMAPSSTRGRYVSSYQLAVTIGILLADIADGVLSPGGHWRVMLGLSIVPGTLLVLVALVMPDTPRWYLAVGRRGAAKATLAKVVGGADLDGRLDTMQTEVSAAKDVKWKDVLAPSLRRALWVGIGLAVFQQVTGINAVIYYSDEIFKVAGFTTPHAQTIATIISVGCVNVLATLIAIAWIDKFGRKPLLYAGLTGMTVALVAMAISYAVLSHHPTTSGGPSSTGIVTLIAMIVYIASFAFSLGPVVWTLISEIFPNRIRGKAMAVATAFNWAFCFIVSATFLSIVKAIGAGATFGLFAVLCIAAFFWIRAKVPETKGKSLEQIQQVWAEHDKHRQDAKKPQYATD